MLGLFLKLFVSKSTRDVIPVQTSLTKEMSDIPAIDIVGDDWDNSIIS